jgi:REP element-mobilizing transposase RayT
LPHEDVERRAQFVTWRLADSIPQSLIALWLEELSTLPKDERKKLLHRRIEAYLDAGQGSLLLKQPPVARVIQESLKYGHNLRYELHFWCIMPNHVHALLTPAEGWPLGKIVQGLKGYTSKEIGKLTQVDGQLWQEDYFDRWMRDAMHFARVAEYIEWNPVKAKLCQDPALWFYSSANEAARSYVLGS